MKIRRPSSASTVTANGVSAYFSGGIAYAQSVYIAPDGSVTPVGSAVAATTADPGSFGVAGSGANLAFPSGIVGSSSGIGTTATRWTWALADLGVTLPTGPLQTTCRAFVTSFTDGTRGGATSYLLWGVGTSATAPSSLVGFSRSTTGTSWGVAYLLNSTTASSFTGAATVTGVSGVRVVGDSTNTDYAVWRYDDESNMSGAGMALSGPSVTTTPTHMIIDAMVTTGTTVGAWTLNAPTFLFRWAVK